ncbi:WD40/YVTN/BNR-like repeat-containing protein [Gracilimonas sp.]|uniref:WD40/YVTN/BNR-like repeat-containing protein n=1 Tax=Gracilimonas sp. TaxID=1974203 RepID=UPI00287222EC|nr:hypothetical protein [Gracilimonas sp.]
MRHHKTPYLLSFFALFLFLTVDVLGQTDINTFKKAVSNLELRSIGPAVMGGRIADIAVNPEDKSEWYVAVGSGNLWKTNNSGTTWNTVFDDQVSYSIGTVTLDPNNPSVVWVGTGENVSGRHVAWGDGVYKSLDAGNSWQHMGLEGSEHIGKILVNPENSDMIFVAAEGPLWSEGGQRGLYKSMDGGESWEAVLTIDEHTGVTDVVFDPSNPEVLYAATYERRRKTWSFMAGGPGSGIYKSVDHGETWKEVTNGLPSGDMGKIGLAVTAADPQIVYATIEAGVGERGFYRSADKGESWEKRNSYLSGGTGPHYYQEIVASQTDPNLVYQNDVFIHVTRNGGATFDYLGNGREKHSDNHALWIDPENGKHLIAGSDGGLYESFDEGTTWKFFPNLPIAQFYKIAIDNAEPFYNVVAGAQDLGTLIGPSRTTNTAGVRNQDWYVPLGADGYDAAFDPENPDIVYMEIQGGELYRLDRKTEEIISIKPRPEPNDPPERYNWDSPVIISPHDNHTLYFGSQRLWKSTDQGDSWEAISEDLTTNTNRYTLEMIDRVPSVDALYDNGAMSLYATLTAISESPIQAGLLYTGSDDGLIHVSKDDGESWNQADALPGVPERSFINDVEASKFNEETVFAVADAHKLGDYSPYIFMSTNAGNSWKSISGDLPDGVIVWSIKQDHIDENLLFIGAENGMYVSPNKGENWIKFTRGVPTIAFRDIELHERDHDLVGGTFGRGIYILDDYSSLRGMRDNLDSNTIFQVRDAWWYVPNIPMQAKGMPSQGSMNFHTPNPEFGAMITYYIDDVPQTAKQQRRETEQALEAEGEDIPFPGWDTLSEESEENAPSVLLLIRDDENNAVRWLQGNTATGLHRITWDLRYPAPNAISLSTPDFQPPWAGSPEGPMAAPGTYSVELFILDNGDLQSQGAVQEFVVKPTPAVEGNANFEAVAAFNKTTSDIYRQMIVESRKLGEVSNKLSYMREAIKQASSAEPALFEGLKELESELADIQEALSGDRTRGAWNEASAPSMMSRIWMARSGWSTTQAPTETSRRQLEIAKAQFDEYLTTTESFFDMVSAFEEELAAAGAPYTPGRNN